MLQTNMHHWQILIASTVSGGDARYCERPNTACVMQFPLLIGCKNSSFYLVKVTFSAPAWIPIRVHSQSPLTALFLITPTSKRTRCTCEMIDVLVHWFPVRSVLVRVLTRADQISQVFPLVFAYCNRSITGGGNTLGTEATFSLDHQVYRNYEYVQSYS